MTVPASERTGQWPRWTTAARELSYPVLQVQISEALQALPRGRELQSPGERFRRTVLAAMSDIEAMEVVDRFFATGHQAADFMKQASNPARRGGRPRAMRF